MTNFTLTRFLPTPLTSVFEVVDYNGIILVDDLGRSPYKFKKIDGDVYYLTSSSTMWVVMLPLTVVIFLLLYLLHSLVNKFSKSDILKSYKYFGLIFVSLIG